jgi:hypothetical protein
VSASTYMTVVFSSRARAISASGVASRYDCRNSCVSRNLLIDFSNLAISYGGVSLAYWENTALPSVIMETSKLTASLRVNGWECRGV